MYTWRQGNRSPGLPIPPVTPATSVGKSATPHRHLHRHLNRRLLHRHLHLRAGRSAALQHLGMAVHGPNIMGQNPDCVVRTKALVVHWPPRILIVGLTTGSRHIHMEVNNHRATVVLLQLTPTATIAAIPMVELSLASS